MRPASNVYQDNSNSTVLLQKLAASWETIVLRWSYKSLHQWWWCQNVLVFWPCFHFPGSQEKLLSLRMPTVPNHISQSLSQLEKITKIHLFIFFLVLPAACWEICASSTPLNDDLIMCSLSPQWFFLHLLFMKRSNAGVCVILLEWYVAACFSHVPDSCGFNAHS